jgi:hypothetical protein
MAFFQKVTEVRNPRVVVLRRCAGEPLRVLVAGAAPISDALAPQKGDGGLVLWRLPA